MLHNLTFGHYYKGDSVIHRLDPRTKFSALVAVILALTANQSVVALGGLLLFLMVLIFLSRVPAPLFLRQLKLFAWIVLLTFVLHAFVTNGPSLVRIPYVGLSVTETGLKVGFYFGFRLLLVISFSVLVMLTTAPTDMTDGVEKMLRPLTRLGVPTHKYALMLGITLRFIPVVFEEGERIRTAQIARGARFGGKFTSKSRALASLVIPLFISVFKRAETLAMALESRGFPGKRERTYYRDLRFTTADVAALAAVLVIAGGVSVL